VPQDFSLSTTAFACTTDRYCEHFPITKCRKCGLVFARYRLPTKILIEQYSTVEDPDYMKEIEGRRRTFQRELARLEQFVPPPAKLLDIGSYTGVFLEVAQAKGYQAVGMDLNQWALRIARSCGYTVIRAPIGALPFRPKSYDCVTLWDVIEHLNEPKTSLKEIYRVLRPGGILALTTHDVESFSARRMGPRYPFLMLMHASHFSRKTLTQMLQQAGFSEIRVFPHIRVLRLAYIAEHLENLSKSLKRIATHFIRSTGLENYFVPVRGAGLMTAIARRP
jgi:ubiquinone/menaquinone biosynthesis C-methylase UbiE